MEPYEATKAVFSRIQSLDPENASKIMGWLLIQDHGEKEMIRLAFGPENLLHSLVVKARQDLGISPNMLSTPSTPSSPTNPFTLSRQNSTSSSRPFLPTRLHIPSSINVSSISSPSSVSSPSWPQDELVSPSSGSGSGSGSASATSMSSRLNPLTPPFYCSAAAAAGELMAESQIHDPLSFLQERNGRAPRMSSGDSMGFNGVSTAPTWGANSLHHRRSYSVSDINVGSLVDDQGFGLGWKPCHYYAGGFCKNGSSCRFVHGGGLRDSDSAASLVGSPSKMEMMEQCHVLLRSKSLQQQKLMAAMASGSPTFPCCMSKGLSLFSQQQQNDSPRGAAALMMGDDLYKFGRSGLDNGRVDSNPASRQIYLTFPADSTFREEDVSNYFSIYGPVQDVRIPYQQKRMFGFVTFVYPETVKMILAKGNPHFVCDARVLVKPYKEKGKVPDKFRKQQQQPLEFSSCNSPTTLDSMDPLDHQLGTRIMFDTRYMLWRRKLEEQADLQQALELQNRRLMGLQLLDEKRNHHHCSFSTGAPIPSPTQSPNSIFNQPLLGSDRSSPDVPDENCGSPPLNDAKQALLLPLNEVTDVEKERSVVDDSGNNDYGRENPCRNNNNFPESLEHNLPDSPFASPTKGISEYMTAFSDAGEAENTDTPAAPSANNTSKASMFLATSSSLDLPSFKSCYFQMPRFSPGSGAVGM